LERITLIGEGKLNTKVGFGTWFLGNFLVHRLLGYYWPKRAPWRNF